jgi:hypothetical protein
MQDLLPTVRIHTVQSVLLRYSKSFRFSHHVPFHELRVLDKLLDCRRGSFGSTYYGCETCQQGRILYSQCHDRHCPNCGWLKRKAWLQQIIAWNLPTTYYHTVFTVPHELNPLIRANPSAVYQLFFRRAQKTLLEIAQREFGCKPGIILTLHTWGQRMLTHVHIHAMMTSGGVSATTGEVSFKPSWIPIPPDAPDIQEKVLAELFQKKFLRGLKILFDQRKLIIPPEMEFEGVQDRDSFHRWLEPLAQRSWKADAQITPDELQTQLGCARYLSDYIQGAAISNNRIVEDNGTHVTIRQWDYRMNKPVEETMEGEEFVRRFLLHIVPSNVHRVRYAGLFQGKGRKETLQRVRLLLAKQNSDSIGKRHASLPPSARLHELELPKIDNRPKCLRCGTPGMRLEGYRDRMATWEFIHRVEHAIEQYSKAPTTLDQLIRSKARLESIAPKQGLLANWKRALAVKEILAWTVIQCDGENLQTEEATLRFGVTCCCVSVNLPLPEI